MQPDDEYLIVVLNEVGVRGDLLAGQASHTTYSTFESGRF